MARGDHAVLFGLLVFSLTACAAEPDGEAPSRAPSPAAAFTRGELSARLPSDASHAIVLENRRLGGAVAVRVLGARGPGAERSGSVVYRSALGEGLDLELEATEGGVRDRVELPHAPPDGDIRYWMELGPEIAGLRVSNGGVELLVASGAPALRVGHAMITDALGEDHEIALDVEGCEADRSVALPWGRRPVPPGANACTLVARLPADLAYPAVYDPLWTAGADMITPRWGVAATVMADGRVMAAGGSSNGVRAEVEVFDPGSATWSALPPLPDQAYGFSLTTLDDGRVLAAGGQWDEPSGIAVRPYAFVFSPATMAWSALPSMGQQRAYHTATKLADGRVLVAGGSAIVGSGAYLASTELFDPSTNTWSSTQSMVDPRSSHTAVEIGGRVLVAGGWGDASEPLFSSELFDPTANGGAGGWVWRKLFLYQRADHAMARLGPDKVLLGGGQWGYSGLGEPGFEPHVEIFDIPSETWEGAIPGSFPVGSDNAAARVAGGAVVMAGGCTSGLTNDCFPAVSAAFYFDPATLTGHAIDPITARGKHQLIGLSDGRAVVFSGIFGGPLEVVPKTEIFGSQPLGEPCEEAFACQSGFCADGVCCDTACDGTCESCSGDQTTGASGTCAPILDGEDPDDECLDEGSPACGTNGACKAGACDTYEGPDCTPRGCESGSECTSGFCVDGICCDTACAGLCEACTAEKNGVGPDGVCLPIAAGRDPDAECGAANLPCTERALCDGSRGCADAEALCAPYVCSSAGCETSCLTDSGCQAGVCVAGACVPADSLCTDGKLALGRDGTVTDCSPFQCNPDGTCRTACASVDDCAPPFVCSPTEGVCVSRPPAEGGDAGCACALGAAEGRSLPVGWVVLLGALLRGRRRRS